jgi:hypothetical protein
MKNNKVLLIPIIIVAVILLSWDTLYHYRAVIIPKALVWENHFNLWAWDRVPEEDESELIKEQAKNTPNTVDNSEDYTDLSARAQQNWTTEKTNTELTTPSNFKTNNTSTSTSTPIVNNSESSSSSSQEKLPISKNPERAKQEEAYRIYWTSDNVDLPKNLPMEWVKEWLVVLWDNKHFYMVDKYDNHFIWLDMYSDFYRNKYDENQTRISNISEVFNWAPVWSILDWEKLYLPDGTVKTVWL